MRTDQRYTAYIWYHSTVMHDCHGGGGRCPFDCAQSMMAAETDAAGVGRQAISVLMLSNSTNYSVFSPSLARSWRSIFLLRQSEVSKRRASNIARSAKLHGFHRLASRLSKIRQRATC